MKITKFGHACLLVEEGGLRALVDPGSYSSGQNETRGLDVILLTHEHQDHADVDSLKILLQHNPTAKIYTNAGVGAVLKAAGLPFKLLEDGQELTVKGVTIRGIGRQHALIYRTLPVVANTGYLIANRFFYPGDALTVPPQPVAILALPIAAPWLKLAEAIDYAIAVKPEVCFPVHDEVLKYTAYVFRGAENLLKAAGIKFVVVENQHTAAF